jgi:flagellar operon protein
MNGINSISNKTKHITKALVPNGPGKCDGESACFGQALEKAQSQLNVKLSKHALARMQSRNLNLDHDQVQRLNRAVDQARAKGIRDTLVLMDDKAFVINIKSTVIVTASDQRSLKERVFTNIDGAVIV